MLRFTMTADRQEGNMITHCNTKLQLPRINNINIEHLSNLYIYIYTHTHTHTHTLTPLSEKIVINLDLYIYHITHCNIYNSQRCIITFRMSSKD